MFLLLIGFLYGIFLVREETVYKNQIPKLTLYTRNPCPLCDELKIKLLPYMNRCVLEEVDIAKKENVRWLRLYRYEIPVLFMNGQYLCKHNLDEMMLEKRLQEFEEHN